MGNRCEIAGRRPGVEPLEGRMAPGAAGPAGAHHPGEGAASAYVAKLSTVAGGLRDRLRAGPDQAPVERRRDDGGDRNPVSDQQRLRHRAP